MQSGDCGVGAGVLFPDGLIVGNGPGRPSGPMTIWLIECCIN